MTLQSYLGKTVTIKATSQQGTVGHVMHKRGRGAGLAIMFLIKDCNGKVHELRPDEITLEESPQDEKYPSG